MTRRDYFIITLITKITISSLVIGFKNVLFSTYSLAKLLSDSLLLDSVRVRFLRARVTLGLNSPRMRIKKGKRAWRVVLENICLSSDFVCRLLG